MAIAQVFNEAKLDHLGGSFREVAAPISANQTIPRGTLCGICTAASANEAQTITFGGTPNGGTFVLDFNGQRTGQIVWSSDQATLRGNIQTALRALQNIGSSGVTVTGLGPFTATFGGALGNQPQPLLVVIENNLTGTSPTITPARTTAGRRQGAALIWDGSRLADPTTGPTVAGNGAGSAFGAGTYFVNYTWVTAAGETRPSQTTAVVITANQNLRVSAITAPAGATAGRLYVNGIFAGEVAVSGGNLPQTDIAGFGTNAGIQPPVVNTAYLNSDGRQIASYVAKFDQRTDEQGRVTLGQRTTDERGSPGDAVGQFYAAGLFRRSGLPANDALLALALTQLGGRVLGAISDANSSVLIPS